MAEAKGACGLSHPSSHRAANASLPSRTGPSRKVTNIVPPRVPIAEPATVSSSGPSYPGDTVPQGIAQRFW